MTEDEMILAEASRLKKEIPYMWNEFAIKIAQIKIKYPEKEIPDEFLLEVIQKGEKMEIWGKDAYAAENLQPKRNFTNWENLRKIMGKMLFDELEKYPIDWLFFAKLYHQIYHKKLENN